MTMSTWRPGWAAVVLAGWFLAFLSPAGSSDYFDIQESRLAFGVDPVGALISYNAENFAVQGLERQEKIAGQGSYFPSLRLGLGLDAAMASYELTVGGGVLLNKALTSPILSADVLASFALAEGLTLGPRVGALYAASPDWKGKDSDISMDGAAGFRGGLVLTLGRLFEDWNVCLSADYVMLELAAKKTDSWWPVDDKKLDLSGLALQAGLVYRPREHARGPRVSPPLPGAPEVPPPPAVVPAAAPKPGPVRPAVMPGTLEPLPEPKPVEPAPPKPAPAPKPASPAPESHAPAPVQPGPDPVPAVVPVPPAPAEPVAPPAPGTAPAADDAGPDDGADVAP
jgi:hypothetical protein